MIGKRKRETTVTSRKKAVLGTEAEDTTSNNDIEAYDKHHDLFRKYFEARFKPIEEEKREEVDIREAEGSSTGEESEGSQAESEWDGISEEEEEEDDEEQQPVEVVAYDASQRRAEDELARAEFKTFMTSKPPTNHLPSQSTSKRPSKPEPETATDSLKNDLSLQRLLQESHLLTNTSNSSLTPTGQNRHKATDLRIQSLSSNSKAKVSIFTQEKMPLSHRRGIVGKAGEREERRRREARENGVVLERETGKGKAKGNGKERKRERGVGGPGVGSFRGGMLNLSKRDVEEIEGPKRKKGGRGGRGR